MTSKVTVTAHCTDDKEVAIIETDNRDPNFNKRTIIQNKEEATFYVYDDRVVTVQELLKV